MCTLCKSELIDIEILNTPYVVLVVMNSNIKSRVGSVGFMVIFATAEVFLTIWLILIISSKIGTIYRIYKNPLYFFLFGPTVKSVKEDDVGIAVH